MDARGKLETDPGFAAAPWLAAGIAFALTLLAFWPGYLSWDSAYQWWQARSGSLDPAHPPVMVRAWMLVRGVLPDPGGMLAVPAALWWSGLALFAHALGGGAWRRVATVCLIGAWPSLLALLPHLWKDVWMTALLAFAVAAMAMAMRTAPDPRRAATAAPSPDGDADARTGWLIVALALLALACAFRSNALPALLPLLAWIGWRWFPARRLAALAATGGALAVVVATGVALNRAPAVREMPVWPAIALWDIAAVSIAEDRLLFPPDWIDPALTVADLRRDFRPDVNVPSFVNGQLKLNFYYDYTPAQFAQLRDAWLALPLRHTGAYVEHRARLSAYLFGLRQAEHENGLVLSPGVVHFGDNPGLAPDRGALNAWLQPKLSALVDTPLFAGWIYLAVSLGLVLRWLWRRDGGSGALSGVVALSGLMLAAPLVLAAPSSDFRYLMWSLLATLMALALAFAARAPAR